MVITYLAASAACIVSWWQWRLVTAWLMLAIPPAAALVEHWYAMPQGGGTLVVTTAYVAALMVDYRLVRKDLG